jgi:hypothetical protein
MNIESQVERLHDAVESFERAVLDLAAPRFLVSNGSWTARDIVAHLVGWNRLVIEGSRQIRAGELPAYDEDPGKDYANVNASLIREYAALDRLALLTELHASTDELATFLGSLEPTDRDRDFGVRHGDETLTIRGTVEDLLADYVVHEGQLRTWPAA